MEYNINIKLIVQLMGDRGYQAVGRVNGLRFKAHLHPNEWKPTGWFVYHISTINNVESIQEAEKLALMQQAIKNLLNLEHYPPKRIDEVETNYKGGTSHDREREDL